MSEPQVEPDSPAADSSCFSEEELQGLHASDRLAARSIVAILLGVFCTGIVMYSVIVYTVIH